MGNPKIEQISVVVNFEVEGDVDIQDLITETHFAIQQRLDNVGFDIDGSVTHFVVTEE